MWLTGPQFPYLLAKQVQQGVVNIPKPLKWGFPFLWTCFPSCECLVIPGRGRESSRWLHFCSWLAALISRKSSYILGTPFFLSSCIRKETFRSDWRDEFHDYRTLWTEYKKPRRILHLNHRKSISRVFCITQYLQRDKMWCGDRLWALEAGDPAPMPALPLPSCATRGKFPIIATTVCLCARHFTEMVSSHHDNHPHFTH